MTIVATLTDRQAVLSAIAEYDSTGREAFLQHYGFGTARRWFLLHNGRHYDSKAIVGAAIGHQHGTPLTSRDFTGGEASVVRRLRGLGFTVVAVEVNELTSRLPDEVPESYPEGLTQTVTVNRAERNPAARARCVEMHGTRCVVCFMTFQVVYGDEFADLIHVHHLKPLSWSQGSREVDPAADLVPVCPNCHAAIHFRGQLRTVEAVQAAVRRKANGAV